jgi:trimeric autotransporter adhesin
LDTFDIGASGQNIIQHSQTSTNVKLGSAGEAYFPGVFAFATDVYQPNICYVENIFKGTTNISGVGAEINEDDNLTVRVYLKNMGNEQAESVQLQHQFNLLFPYIANSANYNNANPAYETVMPPTSYVRTSVSDAAGDDVYEYSSSTLLSKINLGVGATSGSGGTFNPNSTFAVFEYDGTVKALDSNYSNVYTASYVNTGLGIDYSAHPITLSSCNGLTNSFYGIPNIVINAVGFDARETSISMADDNRSITTKIANKPISLNVVSLDTSGALGTYQGINNNRVYLFSVDTSVCSLSESERLSAIASKPRTTYVTFMQDDTNHVSPNFTETIAGKDKKIMMNFINWNQEFIDAVFTCSNSNTASRFKRRSTMFKFRF